MVTLFLLVFSGQLLFAASLPSSGIQVYVAGKKYASFNAYEEKKKNDVISAEKERINKLKKNGLDSMPASEASTGILADAFIGKTVVLRPDGTLITSQSTIDQGKTVEVSPERRVAGIQPSFQQMGEDFDQGKANNGVNPKSIDSFAQLEEQLRRKMRERGRPVLLISDKKKIRVMELQSSQEKAP